MSIGIFVASYSFTFRLRSSPSGCSSSSRIRALDPGELILASAALLWSTEFAACATKFREATRRHAQNGFSDEKLRPILCKEGLRCVARDTDTAWDELTVVRGDSYDPPHPSVKRGAGEAVTSCEETE
jgi:hypothetical protein